MVGCGGFERAEGWPKSAAKTSRVRFAERRTASAARAVISSDGSGRAGVGLAGNSSAILSVMGVVVSFECRE